MYLGIWWFTCVTSSKCITSFLALFAELRKATSSFVMSVSFSVCPSVCPHETTRLPKEGFSWNLIFDCFSTIYPEKSGFIKNWQEERVLYMKTNANFGASLACFFLEGEMFQTKVVEYIQTHILFSVTVFENRALL